MSDSVLWDVRAAHAVAALGDFVEAYEPSTISADRDLWHAANAGLAVLKEAAAKGMEAEADALDAYVKTLPEGVSTEADSAAALLRRAARGLRG